MSFERRGLRGPSPETREAIERMARTPAARIAALTLGMFLVGYFLAANWLFPAAEDPTDVRLVELPDLEGSSFEDAGERLEELGLTTATLARMHHPERPAGSVVAQSPLPGQLARPGDTVRLTLSAGRETRVIPELAGLAGSEAARLLRGLGFEVRLVTEPDAASRAGVLSTRPPAGTRLSPPASIELVVGEGAAIVEVPDLRGRHVDDVAEVLETGELQLGAIRYQVEAPEAPGRVVSQSPAPGSALRGGGFVSIVVAGTPPDSMAADLTDRPTDAPPPPTDTIPGDPGR